MEVYIDKDRAEKNESCFSCGFPFDTGESILVDSHHLVFCSQSCVKMVYKFSTFTTNPDARDESAKIDVTTKYATHVDEDRAILQGRYRLENIPYGDIWFIYSSIPFFIQL